MTPWTYVLNRMDAALFGQDLESVVYVDNNLYDAYRSGLSGVIGNTDENSGWYLGVVVAPMRARPPRRVEVRARSFGADALNKFINDPTLDVMFV